jgi:two-component system cell cycle sensor histidine kinase/response regulator CckA
VALLADIDGKPGEVRTEVLDLDFRTRSGRTVPVRLFHKLAFAADGTPGASRTLVLNRARADGDPQRAAEVRFMRFFHNAPMAIATVDRSGRIVRSNAPFARLHQAAPKNAGAPAGSILTALAERDRPALQDAINRAIEGQGQIAAFDVSLVGEGTRSARLFVSGVEDADKVDEAAIIYAVETTEQKALEAQVNQSQKMDMVGKLAGGMAHDFNNLLSAIMMATDFLLNAHRPTDPSFQDIMQIKQNANRAASLVRHLLAFSRRQTMRPQVLDLGEVLTDLMMLLRRLIGEKVTLDPTHGRDLWPVMVDVSQFEQVIVNLAVNARDAMPDGGRLSLRTANVTVADCARYAYQGLQSAEYVLIEVGDNGTGISPEIVDKIFEPFFTTKEVGKGTGLGLSTVYGIVKQMEGFIFLDSEMGRGTTFRVFLPRHVAGAEQVLEDGHIVAPALVPPDEPSRPSADLTGHGTILLVEDEDGLRGLNARGLSSRGYTVLQAANGVDAIALLEQHDGPIDLVVSDVVMPEMDGPTLLKEMRKSNPSVKFVFVSGYAEDAFEENRPDGQFEFLAKPFTLKQLVAVVKDTMAQKPPASS